MSLVVFPDLSYYLDEYDVIISNKNDGQNYKRQNYPLRVGNL